MPEYNIEKARAVVTDIKNSSQGLTALAREIVNKARNYFISPEKYRELLDFSAKFHNYSFNNTILIMMQNPNASYVGSFKKFRDLGFSVKKGEHGMKIFVPVKIKLIRDGNKLKKLTCATEEEKMRIAAGELSICEKTYFKPGTVFDISQTTIPQEDLPKFYGFMEEKPDSELQFQCMMDIVDAHGIDFEVKDLSSISLKGYYQPSDDKIVLNGSLNNANRLKTLTHEFAHALLHKNSRNIPKAQAEFEAESAAYMTLRQIGADLGDYQFDYIGQYFSQFIILKDADIECSLKRISNTANYISEKYNGHMENIADLLNMESEPQEAAAPKHSRFKNRRKESVNEENPLG